MEAEFRTIFLSVHLDEDIRVLNAVLRKPEKWLHKDGVLFVLGSQSLLLSVVNNLSQVASPFLKLKAITTMKDETRGDWKMVLGFGFALARFPSGIPIGKRQTDEHAIFKLLIRETQEMPLSVACSPTLMSTLKLPCKELCCKLKELVVNA